MIEAVIGLLMFVNGEIKEARTLNGNMFRESVKLNNF